MKRTRVLHCLPWVTSGGVERRRLELARRLDRGSYEQRVVCLRAKAELRTEFERAGVMVEEVGEPYGVRALWQVARAARAFRPSIVHGAVFEGVTMANVAAGASRAPHLIVEEIDYPIHRSWRGHLLFRFLTIRAEYCVAVSPAVLEYLTGPARIAAGKARLIVNGVSAPALLDAQKRLALRGALALPEHAFVVGSIGRLNDSHKRFSDLIRALALLVPNYSDLYLLIVGDGRDRRALELLAESLGVADHVRFAGYQKDVGPWLSVMELFALASDRESFGLVLVEAMFAELSVVATNVGGIRNIVVPEQTGLLVPVANPVAFATAIERLMLDCGLRSRLGRNGRARADALFSAERYVGDVDALYRDSLREVAAADVTRSAQV